MDVEKLLREHDKLIHKTARKYVGAIKNLPTYSYEDIYQTAIVGFLEACNTFDNTKGVPFTAYISSAMCWYISKNLRNKRTVKYPQYFEEIWKLATKYHSTNAKKLSKISGIYTYSQVERAMKWYNYNGIAYLDSNLEEESTLYDTVVGSDSDESGAVVCEYLSSLTTKQKQVVEYLMKDMTQSEIAKEIGVSQQQVSRIIKSLQNVWTKMYEGCDD